MISTFFLINKEVIISMEIRIHVGGKKKYSNKNFILKGLFKFQHSNIE